MVEEIIMNSTLDVALKLISEIIGTNIKKSDGTNVTKESKVDYELLNKQIMLAQNLAIAQRIETADEVEIEEYYDTSKEGTLGAKGNGDGLTFGLSASGKIIEKRIYKFKGYNEKKIEVYEQTRNKVFNPEDEGKSREEIIRDLRPK
jgi:hypothetical protein